MIYRYIMASNLHINFILLLLNLSTLLYQSNMRTPLFYSLKNTSVVTLILKTFLLWQLHFYFCNEHRPFLLVEEIVLIFSDVCLHYTCIPPLYYKNRGESNIIEVVNIIYKIEGCMGHWDILRRWEQFSSVCYQSSLSIMHSVIKLILFLWDQEKWV
jgi:hypothetical protein